MTYRQRSELLALAMERPGVWDAMDLAAAGPFGKPTCKYCRLWDWDKYSAYYKLTGMFLCGCMSVRSTPSGGNYLGQYCRVSSCDDDSDWYCRDSNGDTMIPVW